MTGGGPSSVGRAEDRRAGEGRFAGSRWFNLARVIGRITLVGVAIAVTAASTAQAQGRFQNYAQKGLPPDPGLELLQEEPHDIIYLTPASGGGWVKVLPIPFPGRRVPTSPSGTLKVNVLGIEEDAFVVKWTDIAKIALWEVRLEREARQRIARGDFTGAWPFLSILIRDFPDLPGLRDLRCEFLYQDAQARARRGELESTLAMLEELRRYAPNYKPRRVVNAMSVFADKLMEKLVGEEKFDLAQQLLARLEEDYVNDRLDAVETWNQEFLRMAEEKREAALAALEREDYRAARSLSRASVYLKPEIVGGVELVRKIDKIYPLVNVGVLQSASVLDPIRIDNWAARRAGRLVYRTLFEIQGAGPEGGEYDFLFGETEISPDRQKFELLLEPDRLEPPLDEIRGYYLADKMAARASPSSGSYFPPWAAAVRSIGLGGPNLVEFNLRRPHVLPISLLQIPVDGSWFGLPPGTPTGDYRRDVETDEDGVLRFVLKDAPEVETQPREIVERRLRSGTEGVSRLVSGEIDVVDQLFPADAVRLRKNRQFKVVNYPLPTVHMLVPCGDHPFLAERTFRRALLYGINRRDILSGELLESKPFEGCRVLSGPFPAGIEQDDPLGYAYDPEITPRPFEPPLARLLIAMNESQMRAMAERRGEPMPPMRPLRLAFPADNLSRVACEAIRGNWQVLGLEVELVELPIGRTFPRDDEDIADIVYVAAAVWEPVIDARRVLGPEGLAKSQDQLIGLGLRQLEMARNWREVNDRLKRLHSIAHHELPVLPLWQMVDSYAYRRDLIGMGSDIVSLYQNADNWRLGL